MFVGSIVVDPVFLVKENVESAVMAAIEVPEVHVPNLETAAFEFFWKAKEN